MSKRPNRLPATQWPPILTDVTLPRCVVWRDRQLTVAVRILLLTLARDLFDLVVDHALELFGHPLTEPGGTMGTLVPIGCVRSCR
jgi:hypothetical protein